MTRPFSKGEIVRYGADSTGTVIGTLRDGRYVVESHRHPGGVIILRAEELKRIEDPARSLIATLIVNMRRHREQDDAHSLLSCVDFLLGYGAAICDGELTLTEALHRFDLATSNGRPNTVIQRRMFLGMLAAPAIVHAGSLMPIRSTPKPRRQSASVVLCDANGKILWSVSSEKRGAVYLPPIGSGQHIAYLIDGVSVLRIGNV